MRRETKKEIEKVFKDENLTLDGVIIFGSRARKDFTQESDWDILVIVKEYIGPVKRKLLWRKLYKSLHKRFPKNSFDILLKSQEEFNNERSVVNTISNEAVSEGIML